MENFNVPNGAAAPAPTQATPVVREQDRLMPIANVIRIMRRALPAHAKISDDAKEAIQECVSEFISFVTGEANERCHMEHRKTVNAEDIVWALNRLGFDDYVLPLSVFLHRMREGEAGTGGAGAGDNRAATRAPPRAPPPALHAVPLQVLQRPMYAPPSPVQAQNHMQRPVYAPPVPVQVQNLVQRPVYAPPAPVQVQNLVQRPMSMYASPAPVQVQMQLGIYGPRAPVRGYPVTMSPVRSVVAPHVGEQCHAFGGEPVVAQQYYGYGYGEGAYGAGTSNNGGACADEESSSNGVPVPAVGTEEPEPAEEESQDKPVQSG
ncbi:nuclear transcription factor Y subunit beta-like [Hordeum vulgare subsp. vulgare]|uniref:Transcription factor CBF/NF-Y/archaeal histone domain-containing protein n=1 Tax=Hordeum vulgare subsp. vulgare TaxID=112509 RepID=A0A287W9B1_HORVV|nr:nuclear transcription factor Y subunit beta-like [Hordeum vulgare subsp. vulgare]